MSSQDKTNWLAHYASPYYDPVKAHEYYIKYVQDLKKRNGRKLTDKGTEAKAYIKKNINDERDRKVSEAKQFRDKESERLLNEKNTYVDASNKRKASNIETQQVKTKSAVQQKRDQKDRAVEQHAAITKSKIDSLREKLKNMSPEEKAKYRDSIQSEIDKLREDNKTKRNQLTETYKTDSEKIRQEGKTAISAIRDTESAYKKTVTETYKKCKDVTYAAFTNKKKRFYEEAAQKIKEAIDQLYTDDEMSEETGKKKKKTSTSSSKSKAKAKPKKDPRAILDKD